MRKQIGIALGAFLAMSGMAAAQTIDQWTGLYGGGAMHSFGYKSSGTIPTAANATETAKRELKPRFLNFSGFVGYDLQIAPNIIVGGEFGAVLYSTQAKVDGAEPGLKYKNGSGFYLRSRAGYAIERGPVVDVVDVVDGVLLYGVLGYGSYTGSFSEQTHLHPLRADGGAIEYGLGTEVSLADLHVRVEYIIHNFGKADGVTGHEVSSNKFGVGVAYRF